MRAFSPALLLFPLLFAPAAFGWGCDGHQMVALIARAHLTKKASAAVDRLLAQYPIDPALKRYCQELSGDPMANAATWPDDIRSINKTASWHFVDIPLTVTTTGGSLDAWCPPVGESIDGKDRPGCIVKAIAYNLAILRNREQSGAARADALRYIIHFVGDIHQPLHDADNDDRGGNCTVMSFFGEQRPTNLHSIWDSRILERELTATKTTPAAYAHTLDVKFAAQGRAFRNKKPDPTAWAWEGFTLAKTVTYGNLRPGIPLESPAVPTNCDAERDKVAGLHIAISDDYFAEAAPQVDQQLVKAGNRLAGLLNRTL